MTPVVLRIAMANCVPVTEEGDGTRGCGKPPCRVAVGEALPARDRRLSDELDKVNADATKDKAPARELTVQIRDDSDELAPESVAGHGCGRRDRADLGT